MTTLDCNHVPYFNQVCFATLGHERPWTMETYRKLGGYEAWPKAGEPSCRRQ
ncbi:MAG: hypothetical protein ACT4QB_11030 [Gammaproteobacteria bacterium]